MSNKVKILIIGLPYFSRKIAQSLSNFDENNYYISLNTYEKRIDKIKYVVNLLNADVVYSIGGSCDGSNAIDAALALGKKVIMHWVGTDVLNAISDHKNGRVDFKYIHNIRHFCEVSWIQEELKQIGIDADVVQFATFDKKISNANSLPEKFSVLSYVVKGREEFYGIENLIRLASDFPEVEIKIAGLVEYNKPVPVNIRFLGWVENIDEQYKNCVLYLRMPEHDGLAFSVLEALANARYVGYSHQYEETFHIGDYNKLHSITKQLKEKFEAHQLHENIAGTEFINNNFASNIVLGTLVAKLIT